MRRTFIAVLLVSALALPVCAQRRSFSTGGRAGVSIGRRGGVRVGGGVSFGHSTRWSVAIGSRPRYRVRSYYRGSYGYPYAAYPIYAAPLYDYDSYDYAPVAPYVASPTYVVTTPQPYYPYSADEQVGLDTQMRQQQVGIYRPPAQPPLDNAQPLTAPAPVSVPQPEQPLTVLVYRDGHRAEVHNYAIVGETLWIFSEQRAQKVPLADLNLDATRQANDERGIEFAAPPAQ
ncbi:MAG: hypothetical protein ACRD3E_09840 [Terriglobales bacterium]